MGRRSVIESEGEMRRHARHLFVRSVLDVLGVASRCVNGEPPATTTDERCRWRSPQREPMLPCRAARQQAPGAVAFAGVQAEFAARGRSKAGSFLAVAAQKSSHQHRGLASTKRSPKDAAQLLEFLVVAVDLATSEKCEVDDGVLELGRNRSGA